MSETNAEKEGRKASEQSRRNTRLGIEKLQDIEKGFLENWAQSPLLGLIGQIANNPFTYDEAYKDRLRSALTGNSVRNTTNMLGNAGQSAERLGLGRSDAGGLGLANLAQLQGLGQQANIMNQVENMAAQQRLPDLNNAIGSLFGYINQMQNPSRDVANGLLGSTTSLTGLVGANAGLAGQQSGPLDFLGGLLGSAANTATGLGLGSAFGLFD